MDKIHVTKNIINQKDLEQIITYLKNTPVTFDSIGNSPFGLHIASDDHTLPEILSKYYDRLKEIIETSFNCKVYDEGLNSVVEMIVGDSMPVHVDQGTAQNKSVGLKTGSGYPSRDISSVFYYNDDYEGGEI